jgi:DNA repair exonuclease SbcCD ATPase subunit
MEEQDQVYVEREEKKDQNLGSRLLGFLLRLIFVILVGIAIGTGAYYGIPALYKDFIQPIQTNTERVAALETGLADVQSEIREKQSTLSMNISDVQGEVAAQREDLAALSTKGEGLETRLDEVQIQVDEMQTLSENIQKIEGDLENLSERLTELETVIEEENPPIEQIQRQVQLLRIMELVTRARMWIIQDNLGEAGDDLEVAKEALESLVVTQEGESLQPIIERLDQILFEMSLSPVIAADDLEIVWQLLILATAP